jgi:hypothetical protein
MADYKTRKHTILASDPTVTYPAGSVFTGAALNGETTLEQLEVEIVDANDNRVDPAIIFEPNTAISGLSEV